MGVRMSSSDSYRKIAAELRAKALRAPSDKAAADLDNLARCYIRLAEQADQNRLVDVSAEFGPNPRLDEGEGA
jgi:hypothetical protein